MPSFIKEMQDHIAQLTKERDEARREVCENLVNAFKISMDSARNSRLATENRNESPRLEASRRGWDCYNETV
jgi:predicted RNase H-like nuclease (RuvC/YqgF family)